MLENSPPTLQGSSETSSPNIPYSAYISRVFNVCKFCSFWNHSQNYFNENFDNLDFYKRDGKIKMALFQYFKSVDGQYPGSTLSDPQGVLSEEVPKRAKYLW